MRRWHARLGALSAVVVLMLVITGVLLNHAPGLRLDRTVVRSDDVLDWYRIEIAPPGAAYSVEGSWYSLVGGRLYRNTQAVGLLQKLAGAAPLGAFTLVGGGDTLFLLSADGDVLEQLGPASLPGQVLALGHQDGSTMLRTERGWFQADADLLGWTLVASGAVAIDAKAIPQDLAARVAADARKHELTWERVLRDLHSGRLFGRAGVWVVDAAAVILGGLAVSGLWMWWRTPKRRPTET